MAVRQQQKGAGLGIQYENLVPKSEWKDLPEATILTIDLLGFAMEQIKVTYVRTSKIIRVTGGHPLADRKWRRFNEVFTVPQNCLVDKIFGSFENNVFIITMPKETITKMANFPEASKTAEKRLLEESKRKEKEEKEAKQKTKQLLEEKEEIIRKLQEVAKAKEEAEMRKIQEEAKEKEKVEARKLHEEVKAKEKAEERKLVEEATLEKIQEKKSVNESVGKEKIIKPEERKLPEVVCTKSGSGGIGEVVKLGEEKLGYLLEKEKKMEKGIMEKIRRKEITSEEKN